MLADRMSPPKYLDQIALTTILTGVLRTLTRCLDRSALSKMSRSKCRPMDFLIEEVACGQKHRRCLNTGQSLTCIPNFGLCGPSELSPQCIRMPIYSHSDIEDAQPGEMWLT